MAIPASELSLVERLDLFSHEVSDVDEGRSLS